MYQLQFLPQDRIFWGHDILGVVTASLPDYGMNRPIVFTIEALKAFSREYIQPKISGLVGVFMGLPAHVPDVAVQAALEMLIGHSADSIVAVGGGSVLDAAKAVSLLHFQRTGHYLPIAAFPTTLSGSEFSHYFGVTETDGLYNFKRSFSVRKTVPRLVALDPRLLFDTPRKLLLSSAIKGIDHAVEGMRQIETNHPHAMLAPRGVEHFLAALERWPQGLETRDAIKRGLVSTDDLLQLQLAAWQCYFFPASVIYGLSHRIGHVLGGTFGLPHSVTSCITLARVIRACSDSYGQKLTIFSGNRDTTGASAATALADRISRTVRALELPDRLAMFGFDKGKLDELATLLKSRYAAEVADLGEHAEEKLDVLLEHMW